MTNDLAQTLDRYGRLVGFARQPDTGAGLPDQAIVWTATYARLLLWPTPSNSRDALLSAAKCAQDWFDEQLLSAERSRATPIDGYLLLQLGEAPGDLLAVREVELSTLVCRKSCLWPDDGALDGWRGLQSVGALGLPAPSGVN